MSHLSPLLQQSSQITAHRGQGSYLFDQNGKAYLDFTSGIGVTSTGHCHPKVVAAAQEQVGQLIHGQYTTVKHPKLMALADALAEVLPEQIDSVAFSNSGSESVEAAIRLARHATGRANIVAFQGGFHGRTLGAASLTTSVAKVRTGFHPMMAGVVIAPFPHCYRFGWDEEKTSEFCLNELDQIFLGQSAPTDTAALFIEPVQGEYGYYPATRAFMQGLRERCDQYGILLVCDEIQAGFGRTGKFWSLEHFGVQPDIVITAKGLASGFPISAIGASESLMAKALPGSQGGTYGANAVACAAALATIAVIREEGLVENAQHQGIYLEQKLNAIQERFSFVADIRGLGLMRGMEINDDLGKPSGARADLLVKASEKRGLLLLRCGSHGQVVRWLPPLVVTEKEIDEAIALFSDALEEIEEVEESQERYG